MALNKPVLGTITSWDKSTAKTVTFTYNTDGDLIVKAVLNIALSSSESVVWSQEYTYTSAASSYDLVIPANQIALTNGTTYSVTVRIYNENNDFVDSNTQTVTCYTAPTWTLNVTSGQTITEASYNYTITYYQPPDEGELLSSGYIYIYTSTTAETPVASHTIGTYTTSSFTDSTTFSLTNNNTYYIQAVGTTVGGTALNTGRIQFTFNATSVTRTTTLTLTNNCMAGTIGISVDVASGVSATLLIQRSVANANQWVTIGSVNIGDSAVTQTFTDNFVTTLTQYTYRACLSYNNVVSVMATENITTHFNGVYICDADTIFRFYAGVSYNESEQHQSVGVYNPIGKKYPVFVSSGMNNYQTGSFVGKILCDWVQVIYYEVQIDDQIFILPSKGTFTGDTATGYVVFNNNNSQGIVYAVAPTDQVYVEGTVIVSSMQIKYVTPLNETVETPTQTIYPRKAMVDKKNQFIAWLTNKKGKILKDWNGNIWLIHLTNNPTISYENQWGMGLMDVTFQYAELGDPYSEDDLTQAGLI